MHTSCHVKRSIDLLGAAILLAVTSPVLLLASAAVMLTMGWPAWFRQTRSGLHGKPFQICKIRTMLAAQPGESTSEDDCRRLTPLGQLLRRTSIDELPQFWNVLRGDMSLVGPRPLLVKYAARYSAAQARRLEAKPGITGCAQIGGRNGITWAQRFELDLWYVQHGSLWIDILILLRTPAAVFCMTNTSAPGQATIREFGNSPTAEGAAAPALESAEAVPLCPAE